MISGYQLDLRDQVVLDNIYGCAFHLAATEDPSALDKIKSEVIDLTILNPIVGIDYGASLASISNLNETALSTSLERLRSISVDMTVEPDTHYMLRLVNDYTYEREEKNIYGTINFTMAWLYWHYIRNIIYSNLDKCGGVESFNNVLSQ